MMKVLRRAALLLSVLAAVAVPSLAAAITVTNLNDAGIGSLRWAIGSASPGDTVDFAGGLNGTIVLTSASLDIGKKLTIDGPGAGNLTVSGDYSHTVFTVANADVTIRGLTIADGDAEGSEGGGIFCEDASLNLIGCTIKDCYAGGAPGLGGGIFAVRALLSLEDCTVSANHADDHGGGIFTSNCELSLVNCTVSGNYVYDGDGGGIRAEQTCLSLAFCTITGNDAGEDGGGVWHTLPYACGGIDNTIFYGNTCGYDGDDFYGSFDSYGYNLIGDLEGDYDKIENSGTDSFGQDPNLGPLQDNGGPTQTRALLDGSPALDAGSCEASLSDIDSDQRGIHRPQGDACDIGAYEYEVRQSVPPRPSGCGVNRAPIPNAGADQVACVGEVVILDGSKSRDPDEGIPPNTVMGDVTPKYAHQQWEDLIFRWEVAVLYYAAGRPVLAMPDEADVLASAQGFDSVTGTFIPNVPGVYQLDLFVTDDFGDTTSDRVTIAVVACPDYEPLPAAEDEFRFERFIVSPNPSPGEVLFGYIGGGAADAIAVTVLDLRGSVVWEARAAGATELTWDGRGSDGRLLAAGPYVYRIDLVAGGMTQRGEGLIFLKR